MMISFTRHFTQRLRERFAGSIDRVTELVEQGVFEKASEPADGGQWFIHGYVDHKPVRIVYAEEELGRITLVTVMWIDGTGFRFGRK